MLKPPKHQVAGHRPQDGRMPPPPWWMAAASSTSPSRATAGATARSPCTPPSPPIRPSLPASDPSSRASTGTLVLPASDASGPCVHLALDDLLASLRSPSVIDLKMGAGTWPPDSPNDYLRKCLAKDRGTTSVALSFRVSGVQIQDPGEADAFWRTARADIRQYTAEDVRRVLRQFVSTNPPSDDNKPDCAFAPFFYGGPDGVLWQLLELKAWFEEQTLFHFYSASILLVYEKDACCCHGCGAESWEVRVKLVDFAHVVEGNEVIVSLCSLIKFISDIVTDPEGGGRESNKLQLSCETGSSEKLGNLAS